MIRRHPARLPSTWRERAELTSQRFEAYVPAYRAELYEPLNLGRPNLERRLTLTICGVICALLALLI